MEYQLWTSPIAGYRRKGTRLSELRSALGIGVTARTILEPLQSCLANSPAKEIAVLLRERGFDTVGLQETESGPVIGFARTKALVSGTIKQHTESLRAEHLVSDSTPLSELVSWLRANERVFVLVGPEVKGIITLADLNKPSARIYLFGLVSLLEMHVRFWILLSYRADAWKDALRKERLEAANALQGKRRGRNEEILLVDCLQFCDKRDLVLARSDLRTKLGLISKNKSATLLERAEDLRNRLAHSQHDLVQGTSWRDLIELGERLEAIVHRSDDAVEELAKSNARGINPLYQANA